MFKKIAAATMALIIAIMPMTASAVTWSTVVGALNATGSYSGEGITAEFNADKTEVTVSGNGTLEGDDWGGRYVINMWTANIGGVSKYIIEKDVTLDADELLFDVYDDDVLTVVNKSDFDNSVLLNAFDDGQLSFINEADLRELYLVTYGESNVSVKNDGNIQYATADVYDDSSVAFSGSGKNEVATVYINADSIKDYTSEELAAIIKEINLKGEDTVNYLWTMDEEGYWESTYVIAPDGTLTLVDTNVENPEIPEEKQELSPEAQAYLEELDKIARKNHERELKRHAEAIGGVTASPEWCKQLYLGYMSLNLRVYENGAQELFRERLAWVGDGTKNLTLRVDIDQPQALSIRIDERALDKLEQAEISLVTLLAKEGAPVMQYKVSDLRGAYEMYGLMGEDLLVVGGVEDEVMKIGADGQMVPVETEETTAE